MIDSKLSRRAFIAATAATTSALFLSSRARADVIDGVVDISSRRELFVDSALIENLDGEARLQLHHPTPREIVMKHDASWEGTGSGYHNIFRDGDRYRMYYKAWHLEVANGGVNTNRHPLYCCYAESNDGINWTKPNLGLFEHEGSKDNNIVMTSGPMGPINVDAGHPAVFKDDNPDATADAKYKAIFRSQSPNGLLPFKSPDGIHWSPMTDAPILHGLGAFDSQNLAFWDPNIGKYRAYWRIFTEGVTNDDEWKPGGYRAIRTATSDDLITWGPHTDLTYEDSPNEQLYTNQIKPYHRAPHILMGFPARYIDRGWSDSMRQLPNLEGREARANAQERYGTAITETLLMASRDGIHFNRWNEAFMRPGVERPDNWHYGQQYIAWHLVETPSHLPGAPDEISIYSVESYWHGPGSEVRRYTLRLDGFVSAYAPMDGGTLTTKPITFTGSKLELNFSTSAAGQIRIELQDTEGAPIPGYSLDDCPSIFGDSVARTASWKGGSDLSKLAGQPLRVRFELKDADLYAYRFNA